jgi:hypothetical protein
MTNYNWSIDMPKDVWGVILKYCDAGCTNMLFRVSHRMGQNIGKCPNVNLCNYGALHGCIDTIIWARANGSHCTSTTCDRAVARGHFEVVKWLCSVNCPLSNFVCNIAARHGHLDIYKFLRENKCVYNRSTWESALEGGYLEVIIFLQDNEPRRENTGAIVLSCTIAAKRGHLEVIQWLRKHGYPWNKTTCEAAASGGHLDVLRYIYNNGCKLNIKKCAVAAAGNGHSEVLQWLHKINTS